MKNFLRILMVLTLSWTGVQAQTIIEITEDISSNTSWTKDHIYVLKGVNFIYVKNNAVLTVEAGTLVKGDPAALVITRGSKIIAEGTPSSPIVFTSNQPAGSRTAGDWGGLALLGKARINSAGGESLLEGGLDADLGKYGGTDDADNSGILRYVRIEFAGIAFQPNNEINSLTMGGVGSGTVIDHVQTSYGGDDAFEWFGGNVNGKFLVGFRTVDDLFDTDFGYSGKNQFVVGISDPNIADISGSNGFESDNDAQGSTNTPQTAAVFSNVSIIGPKQDENTVIDNNFKRAIHIRRNSIESIRNSVFTGFPLGIRLESAGSENAYLVDGTLKLQQNIWAGNTKMIDSASVQSPVIGDSLPVRNQILATIGELNLTDPFHATQPNLLPKAGSPALTGANFTGMDAFFTQTAYKGAFGADNWTRCWCEFDPQNADYSTAIDYSSNIPASFSAIVTNNSVAFTAPAGTGFSYAWNFGDFTTGTEGTATHEYQALGTYQVTLVVTNERGCQKTITQSVTISSGTSEIAINNNITTNTTWTNDKIYRLTGGAFIYVTNNATLTIEPGTIVKGDPSALVITRGSKIIADGTETQPIIFTSGQPAGERKNGDWGGLALLGKAKINSAGGESLLEGGLDTQLGKYGGNDDADNSGILRYVRIEFAGIAFQPNNEINALTMGGVGTATTIEHVQTSYGGDDAFEWFGGSVNGKFLIANSTVDDMFDTDFGYSGKNQFVLGISNPDIADISGSNAFESDNDAQGSNNTPNTNATFVNVSVFGPLQTPTTPIDANFKRALHIRRNSRQDIINSVFTGFPLGVRLESAGSENAYLTDGSLVLRNNIFAAMTKLIDSASVNSAAVGVKLLADGNAQINDLNDLNISDPFNPLKPDFRPEAGSQVLSGAFADIYNDTYFTPVTYRGAFDQNTDWTACWSEWDAQHADYSLSPVNYFTNAPSEIEFNYANGGSVEFTGPAGNDLTYAWNFGDNQTSTEANPVHQYAENTAYTVTLKVTNSRGCSKTVVGSVLVTTGTKDLASVSDASLSPNPSQDLSLLSLHSARSQKLSLSLSDMSGCLIRSSDLQANTGINQVEVRTADLPSGLYTLRIQSAEGIKTLKLQVIR